VPPVQPRGICLQKGDCWLGLRLYDRNLPASREIILGRGEALAVSSYLPEDAVAPPTSFSQPEEIRTRKGRILVVREYAGEDYQALVEMYREFEPKREAQGLPPPDLPRIDRWLRDLEPKSRWVIASSHGRIVGHAILCPISGIAVEFTIFVFQGFRGEGLGTLLAQRALYVAGMLGFKHVYLTTEFSNVAAVRLYRKLGFQVTNNLGEECEMKLDLESDLGLPGRAA
jgi:GNAT superfamily N-acetyltransferase